MDILKNRYIYLWVSLVLAIFSVFMILFWKMNLAIDMTWWINLEYSYEKSINIDQIRDELDKEKDLLLHNNQKVINNISVYSITWEKAFSVVVWFDSSIDESILNWLKTEFKAKTFDVLKTMDSTIVETKYTNIWKSFWDYIRKTAILTLWLAIVWIAIYVSYAFSWVAWWISTFSFAIITLITLFHDVIIAAWLYIVVWYFYKDYQIDTFFITALLTILGYSINDTVVIFDRIRDNLRKFAWKPGKEGKDLYEIINLSITETLRRSFYTSLTLILVLFTIFFFGPESLSGFILTMLLWVSIGTYSSIYNASPLLYEFNKNKKLTVYKKIVVNPDDKIVV